MSGGTCSATVGAPVLPARSPRFVSIVVSVNGGDVMSVESAAPAARQARPEWYAALSEYARSDRRKAIWQVIDTLVPYLALWALMLYLIRRDYPVWTLLPPIVAASALLVRTFILFHDCTHGSFFNSSRANAILGFITGVLTFTSFEDWRRCHGIHHNTVADLDRRSVGDILTMTVEEYRSAPRWKRMAYRVYRNPLVLFGPGPAVNFLIIQRLPTSGAKRRQIVSVILTDLAILGLAAGVILTFGWRAYLLIQLPVMVLAASIGVWFFYVQHQFEGTYWARHENWDSYRASVQGSSWYRLPGILNWVTGHIGLHHIHHLRPRIPNYHLADCLRNIPALATLKEPLTIRGSFRCLFLNLWDEEAGRLVSFREAKQD